MKHVSSQSLNTSALSHELRHLEDMSQVMYQQGLNCLRGRGDASPPYFDKGGSDRPLIRGHVQKQKVQFTSFCCLKRLKVLSRIGRLITPHIYPEHIILQNIFSLPQIDLKITKTLL